MKKRGFISNYYEIFIISLLSILLSFVIVSAQEFKSCSADSDCKVDVCNENSCINQSYQIPQCTSPNLLAKECRCVDNICSVLVGSVSPVCDTNHPGITYCKDEKTSMTCDAGTWVSKTCVFKCENGQCLEGCYKNEDCGASYIKTYCSNNGLCLDTTTPTCLNTVCGSNTVQKCTPCTYGCKEGRCLEGTAIPSSCQVQAGKCQDGTIPECKLVDSKCVCAVCPVTPQPTQICTDTDNGNFYEKGIIKGATDDTGHWDLCGDYNTLTEYYCENNEARKTTFSCPNGCKDGACIKGESISEKVICGFANSNQEQKCYTAEQNSRAYCSGIGTCVAEIKGQRDEKITWKSSCGQYQYTIIDGNDEKIGFDCTSGETNIIQIRNNGFRHAYFQCYDGEESKSIEREACKTAEFWKKFAENFCQSHCIKKGNIEKCGINTFSLVDECYFEGETTIPTVPTIPATENAAAITPNQGMLYYFYADNCPNCQEIDKEIGILKQKGFFNDFGAAVFNINEEKIADKYEIKAVPSFILYKGGCSFRKQGLMKSEEIEAWAYGAKCEEPTESILVCKDSCPLDGKCYPFGYRKGGKYCSDNGGFVEQLKGELTCENNFECSSNVCVSGKCISEGFIQKILKWFKRLFGAE